MVSFEWLVAAPVLFFAVSVRVSATMEVLERAFSRFSMVSLSDDTIEMECESIDVN